MKVIIDYKSLKYFMTTKKLSRRQVSKVEFLSRFNFVISYTLSRKIGKTDSFTYSSNVCLADDYDNQ